MHFPNTAFFPASNQMIISSTWKTPQFAQEIDQQEIEVTGTGTRNWTSTQPVKSISTSFGTFERSESNAVQFLDFGFDRTPDYVESGYVEPNYVKNNAGIVVGIEVKLVATRLARIQDKTIQLVFQNKPISENKQNLLAADTHIYGDAHDRWGITSDKPIPVESEQFGVIIDLQPHESIPSSETVYIRSVSMRVHYAPKS